MKQMHVGMVVLAMTLVAGQSRSVGQDASHAGEAGKSSAPVAVPPEEGLGGPKVQETKGPATLVNRDGTGRLVPLEVRPELAATGLLGLDAEQKRKVEELFVSRLKTVTELVRGNTALLLKLQGARQSGATGGPMAGANGDAMKAGTEGAGKRADKDGYPELIQEIRKLAGELLTKPLAVQVTAVLPEEKRGEFSRLVDEYKAAAAAEEDRPGRKPGPVAKMLGASEMREEAGMLLREVARTLKGIVKENRARAEELYKAVEATPEQQSKIQAIYQGGGDGAGLKRTQAQRGQLIRKIMEVLTPEQRKLAVEYFREQRAAAEQP